MRMESTRSVLDLREWAENILLWALISRTQPVIHPQLVSQSMSDAGATEEDTLFLIKILIIQSQHIRGWNYNGRENQWKNNFNNTSFSAEDLEGIKIGDIIYLNGSMTTCRDVAHRRVVEEGQGTSGGCKKTRRSSTQARSSARFRE